MSTRKPALVTNHWTIMKLQCVHDVRHISSLPTFNLPGGQQVVISDSQKGVPSDEGNLANTNGGGCPTAAAAAAAAGSYSFYPGTMQWHHASSKTALQPSPSRRTQTASIYNDHARQGFRYWYEDDRRPKTTKFGRYGIGTYKTMFGLGSAPRT